MYSPSGHPVEVVATRAFEANKCYKVTLCNDVQITAGAGHLWRVTVPTRKRVAGTFIKGQTHGKRVGREERIVTTEELSSIVGRHKYGVGIAISRPLAGDDSALPIDPYLLGVWLGDGFSSIGAICGVDHQIFDEVRRRGHDLIARKIDESKHPDWRVYRVVGLTNKLRSLGLIGNKHIPDAYFCASERQRRELLWGLIDTDGHVATTRNATVEFCNMSHTLASQVRTLAISLGYKARITPNRTFGNWIVSFQAYADDEHGLPCFLERKRRNLKSGIERHSASKTWYVRSVQECGSVPTNCIQVSNEDGMYLAGKALVPTHNSSVITFGLTIQEILASHGEDPIVPTELTFGIFSHTRPIAKAFLRQIKIELETNERLKEWFPDILWKDPRKEALKWSEDEGIIVRRKSNPKEATVEAWGLVDGQPTSKHYLRMVYDDVVTRESVTTPEMIKKTTEAWELSRNLSSEGGESRYIGTRYHFLDTYKTMMERGIRARVYPATVDGTASGDPVLMSRETLAKKRVEMGATFNSQMLQNPSPDEDAYFKKEWFRWYDTAPQHLAKYGASDFAVTAKGGDFTVHLVVGVDPDDNLYILDVWRKQTTTDVWIDQMIARMQQHKPFMWSVPGDQIRRSIGPFLTKRMAETRTYVTLHESSEAGDKPSKARSFQGRMSTGKVYFPKRAEWLDDLIMEMSMFPVGHDDQVDTLGQIGRMLGEMATGYVPPSEEDKPLADYGHGFADDDGENWKVA